jgi:arsenate reductase (thioredoxin)
MRKTRVLFLCTGNSARSQMAEAFLRLHGGDAFEAQSAGLEPAPINPLTIVVMGEKGLDLQELHHRSKGLIEEFFDRQVYVGYLITVCRKAESSCPIYPWAGVREFWDLEDPAAFQGTESEKLDFFRTVRDTIEERVLEFISRLEEQKS